MNRITSQNIETFLLQNYGKSIKTASTIELYNAVSRVALGCVADKMYSNSGKKRAGYLSAEYLVGRVIYANLYNMGEIDTVRKILEEKGIDLEKFEEIEDLALGNGGLGRLAACFLDSAATCSIPLDGYGIRYRYGLFKQSLVDGFQTEGADDWQRFGDPWSIRREEDVVEIVFGDQEVKAVPYDMPIIGYGGDMVNTLRLWQSEPKVPFDFIAFNDEKYSDAVKEKNRAEDISRILYPKDDTYEGKKLRLKQQYLFSSASLQDIVRKLKRAGRSPKDIGEYYSLQLNDTHPVVAIPELIRILVEEEELSFSTALKIAEKVFAYTNHTIMPEALEKWDVKLFKAVLPKVYPYVRKINSSLKNQLKKLNIPQEELKKYSIIEDNKIFMARMAIYATHSINGVAQIHTEILKNTALPEWYKIYPQRFNNKTNGITQRRWLALANQELSSLISTKIGEGWITDLSQLKALEKLKGDEEFLHQLREVKQLKKNQLAAYIEKNEGIKIDTSFIFDVQIKRLHEYKRQLLNAFSILDTYYGIKEGRIKDFKPTVYIFGAKAAPGYFRAKGIIKLINEISRLIREDPVVNKFMQVVFISNYNVSYAEKIVPAADISEQISTAGTEASGTGNMKLMLNGALTIGTYDGANVEIVQQAGEENNYIFGARVEDIAEIEASYNPSALIEKNPRLKVVVEALIDGTLRDEGTEMFQELYDSITEGASWHKPDHYYLMLDFIDYCDTRLRANQDFKDPRLIAEKSLMNIANAGSFSSDRTIKQYAEEIWQLGNK
ncbi:glycogen/starch/alpha-glucan phosphorylase [Clostridium polynesiense]|uniref:glycogen/starch/alpha-glucan phosphorylase n=1 Tax=Clostridium polynesiense TaxID=1325933 RepID=UPI0005902510|nr:glycogen/starch/alpha-glucan phosphorylase [Clostridium polynesiense]